MRSSSERCGREASCLGGRRGGGATVGEVKWAGLGDEIKFNDRENRAKFIIMQMRSAAT